MVRQDMFGKLFDKLNSYKNKYKNKLFTRDNIGCAKQELWHIVNEFCSYYNINNPKYFYKTADYFYINIPYDYKEITITFYADFVSKGIFLDIEVQP